jgi:hypothetical protein
MGALVDSFRGATLNTSLWTAVNTAGNSGQQAGGQYTFIVQAGATGDASIRSNVAYNLTGSHLHIELIDAGVQQNGLEMYPIILTQNPANIDNSLLVVVSNGLVGLYQFVAGVGTGLAFPAYDPVAMRWWRIRSTAGTVYYESSPDHRTWTVRASVVPTIAITALYARVRTFCFLSLATAKTTAVSNANFLAPPDVPFPNGAIPVGMEIAFGADLSASQVTWPWVSVTPADGQSDLMKQDVSVTRGRADESSDVAPTAANIDLDNPTGDYTPDNPLSIHFPNVELGTPARWWLQASTSRLYLRPLPDSNAQVASIASLNLTADLDVRIDLHIKTMDPSGLDARLMGRENAGGTYSWRVDVRADRRVTLYWSADGTTDAGAVTSSVPALPMSARSTLRITLDVNNGAGGHEVKFYASDSVTGTFTQVGATFVGVGVTSIFNATAPLSVGVIGSMTDEIADDADVYRLQLRNGIGGTVIADADFQAQTSGLVAFVDSVGLAWTVGSAAELSNRWFRIVGTVDEWAPTWPYGDLSAQQDGGVDPGEARVTLAVAGILRRLGQGATPLNSPLRLAMLDAGTEFSPLVAYWPMEDANGSTQFASGLPGGNPMSLLGTAQFSSDTTLPGSRGLPVLDDSSQLAGPISGVFSGVWEVDWFIEIPSPGPVGATTIMTVAGSPGASVALWVITITGAALTVVGRDSLGVTLTTVTTVPTGLIGGWAHMSLHIEQIGTGVEWLISYTPVTYPIGPTFIASQSYTGSAGSPISIGVPQGVELGGIAIGHVGVFAGTPIAFGVDTGATGNVAEVAAQRMARLCAAQGISFRVIGDPNTTEQMGVQQSATLLTLLNDGAHADGGILYERRDAVGLVYRTREAMYNQPPNMTLNALLNENQNPFAPLLDDQRVRNDVTVTRQGGSSFQVIDPISIEQRGQYPQPVTLNLYVDTQLGDAAGWLLHRGTAPGMRYPELTTNLGVAPEVIDAWLTMDEGARVDVINLPPQHPVATVQVVAEGFTEPVSPTTWVGTMNCSPASVWDVAVISDVGVPDTYLLRLDTDGSQLAAAVTDVATALSVVVTAGPAWVTSGGEFPFDVRIDGEQLTVTSIGAAAGGAATTGAGNQSTVASTSFVAPSVAAPASGDLLLCAWTSAVAAGTYTLPGGMTIGSRTDGFFSSMEEAKQTLGASGATGTRTATFSSSKPWSAVSVAVHAATGSPGVAEVVSGYSPGFSLILTTINSAPLGSWLIAINGWDYDPGNNMNGPGAGWMPVADSMLASVSTSRTRIWARRVSVAGRQSVTFPAGGANDNHGRLYVLSGVTGPTQAFTVTRNVNGAARAHAIGSDVELWFQPVLAR